METYTQAKTQSWLVWFLKGILILGFFILLARLIDLQIIRGSYYKNLADENRIRRIPLTSERGRILARGGEVIVGNREVKKRLIFPKDSLYEKSVDIKNAGTDEIITEPLRDYLLGNQAAHITGYLGEANEEEVGKVDPKCPEKGPRKLGSFVGRSGLEYEYECLLSGYDGEELVEVDSVGKKIRSLGRKEAIPGMDLITTIDFGLQKEVSSLLTGKKGAIVVTDPGGEILAFYSGPSFDPNIFINPEKGDELKKILTDENFPLFNRVISGTYHPGSIVKPLISITSLEEDVVEDDFIYEDTGSITLETAYGTYNYNNWYFTQYGGKEGKINVKQAISRSTDTFFYKIGELTGIEKISNWLNKFGLGSLSEIDLPGEVSGLVPSPEWKLKAKGERWFLGNTYHLAIGQGDIAVTPLAINAAIGSIASEGLLCQPHFVKEKELEKLRLPINFLINQEKDIFSEKKNFYCQDLGISQKTIETVRQGMIGACSSGGTGYTFFDINDKGMTTNKSDQISSDETAVYPNEEPGKIACKTGTAEIYTDGDTHAWFTFFAPALTKASLGKLDAKSIPESEIVVTVLVEKGGEGSKVAGPIAREIFDYWFGEAKRIQDKVGILQD
ncbi:hypothetical protein A2Z22_04020 [Candidatus Woesebacteria bacterium RBG_16_34_12]|uniref:Penicillin-binding protein 2 n=1 Tax=Candidatus Woesebacteria bacterium RBG_16_34_12 TaxID=1802480 RepID=A0A1F7X7E3_9BACT|nr:MAG: hypothetical protein A2Z22_04020 [Candidatus Woesebacteria bacterium RBG_16_34_12]